MTNLNGLGCIFFFCSNIWRWTYYCFCWYIAKMMIHRLHPAVSCIWHTKLPITPQRDSDASPWPQYRFNHTYLPRAKVEYFASLVLYMANFFFFINGLMILCRGMTAGLCYLETFKAELSLVILCTPRQEGQLTLKFLLLNSWLSWSDVRVYQYAVLLAPLALSASIYSHKHIMTMQVKTTLK